MSIKIHNTLTRKKQEFVPLKEGHVGIYVCGPTVYDEPHIGHARSAYVFDVIRRYFIHRGYKVKFVRNVTDIDDKIINKAKEEFKGEDLKSAVKNVTDKYLKVYHDYMERLGIMQPDIEPKATEYIDKMIGFIQILVEQGAAYVSGSDVYFDVRKTRDYGRLSNQSFEMLESGARITPGENKKDPLDFALWKSAKEGEPSWESPWGKGRPGWHIECSVMSSGILGDEFDIHGGGIDLVFPHHENEIAQSQGAGRKFARYWIHNGLLTIDKEKMAKSLGNFITIEDFIKQNSDLVLKLFFLSAHYRSPLDYNEKALHMAEENVDTIGEFFNIIKDYEDKNKDYKASEEFKEKFIKAMDDDFNTPIALSILLEMVSAGHKSIINNKIDIALSISKTLEELLNIFGLQDIRYIYQRIEMVDEKVYKLSALQNEYKEIIRSLNIPLVSLENRGDEIELFIKLFITLRDTARQKKDFVLADKIRTALYSKVGIILEDTKNRTIWKSR